MRRERISRGQIKGFTHGRCQIFIGYGDNFGRREERHKLNRKRLPDEMATCINYL